MKSTAMNDREIVTPPNHLCKQQFSKCITIGLKAVLKECQ